MKAGYDISTFAPQVQVVLKALKHYGLILTDNGSNWYFQGTEDSRWKNALLDELKTVPGSAFEAVDESSCMIDPDSAASSC